MMKRIEGLDSVSTIQAFCAYDHNIIEIGNIAFSLILFNETGADNTDRNSNDTNPQISDADCHYTSQSCDWVNVTIAYGKKCRHATRSIRKITNPERKKAGMIVRRSTIPSSLYLQFFPCR